MCAAKQAANEPRELDAAAAVGLFGVQSTIVNLTSGRPIASWSVSTTTQDGPYGQLMAGTVYTAVASEGREGASMNQSCNTGKRTKKLLLLLEDEAGYFSRLSTTLALTISQRPSAS